MLLLFVPMEWVIELLSNFSLIIASDQVVGVLVLAAPSVAARVILNTSVFAGWENMQRSSETRLFCVQ